MTRKSRSITAVERAYLDLLLDVPSDFMRTAADREEIAAGYEAKAAKSHPAVADLLKQAARRVRDNDLPQPD
ncbi:hypothetical protein JJJ17_07180 [Paracoccus caeni]|uniref:Uncharacterized protein n=1 Tax=Paracoccus caeni TaxID=657651 RepID=A0A934VY75_9RHOB|nr:hypothetical protein [Paracoccus caeni]MBK4215702.1 hypothetical protein [Paracoccus caeni]